MPEEEKEQMGCKSRSWIKNNFLVWYRATIYHNNNASVVKEFCGDQCRFPSCVSTIIRTNETQNAIVTLPDGHGAAQERALARASADGLLPDPSKLENRLNQMWLWLSDRHKEGGK